jgi:mRNA guanylyltransferase
MPAGNHPPPPSIPGVKAELELARTLRQDVQALLGRNSDRFPGAQPVSFAARHIEELQKQDYYVCEKSDGVRCLVYLTHEGLPDGTEKEITYLIDRKNDYYWVEGLHFPLPDDEVKFHRDTLIDGELVNDRLPDGSITTKYLVFDCLALSNRPLMPRPLDKRLAYFGEHVYKPYTELYDKYPEEKSYRPFEVKFKEMHKAYGIEEIFRVILPRLAHGNDGLIFTCRTTPYKCGTDPHILKWKPADENSVDFRLILEFPLCDLDSEDERRGAKAPYPDWTARPLAHLYVQGDGSQAVLYGQLHLEQPEWIALKARDEPLDERVIECYQDSQHRWRFMRFRDDKRDANHISVVENVLESIQDRISEDDLIAAQDAIRSKWKAREAAEAQTAKQPSLQRTASNPNGVNNSGRP